MSETSPVWAVARVRAAVVAAPRLRRVSYLVLRAMQVVG